VWFLLFYSFSLKKLIIGDVKILVFVYYRMQNIQVDRAFPYFILPEATEVELGVELTWG
jgi:hypothetical protein